MSTRSYMLEFGGPRGRPLPPEKILIVLRLLVTMDQGLLNIISAREGHFRLESGYHSGLWLGLDPLFLSPTRLQPFVNELAIRLSRHGINAVCGPLTGGAFLAQSLAARLEIEFYFTERFLHPDPAALYPFGYRLPDALCERVSGKAVAIVDDVTSAGSAARGTFTAVQSCGAIPACMGALLVLGNAASTFCSDHEFPLEQVAWMEYNLWTPSECPLCASAVPLEDRVSGPTL